MNRAEHLGVILMEEYITIGMKNEYFKEQSVHNKRDKQKREAWINNVIRVMKYTREKAESEYARIFK